MSCYVKLQGKKVLEKFCVNHASGMGGFFLQFILEEDCNQSNSSINFLGLALMASCKTDFICTLGRDKGPNQRTFGGVDMNFHRIIQFFPPADSSK